MNPDDTYPKIVNIVYNPNLESLQNICDRFRNYGLLRVVCVTPYEYVAILEQLYKEEKESSNAKSKE